MWSFIKDFLIYGFASVLGKLVAVLLMPVYTSILTREEYGAMALILSCYGIIDLFANLNIHSGIARDYYEEGIDRNKLVSTGFWSILIISVCLFFILLLTRNFWFSRVLCLDSDYFTPFIIMLCSIPFSSLQTYFSVLTRYKKNPLLFSAGTLLQLVVSLGISIYGVVFLKAGIGSIFLGSMLGSLSATIFFAFINKDLVSFTFKNSYIVRALRYSLPTLPAILAGWVDNSLGQIVIAKYVSLTALGVYSIAVSVSSVFSLITFALMNVWTPFLYENYRKPNFILSLRKLFSVFAIGLMALSTLLSLFSEEIILLLATSDYLDACKYITLLCIPMCFYLLFPIASSGVSISRDTKYIGISYVLGSILNLSLLFLLIGRLGVIAIPLCLAASRIFTYFYLYSKSKQILNYQMPNNLLLYFIVLVAGFFFVNEFCLSFFYRLIITLILLIVYCLLANRHLDISLVVKKIRYERKGNRH